jgi:hypothetical protein
MCAAGDQSSSQAMDEPSAAAIKRAFLRGLATAITAGLRMAWNL